MNSHTLYTVILFAIVSSPQSYELVRNFVGLLNKSLQDAFATASGRPKILGLIIHGIVFALLLNFVTKRAGYLNAGQTGPLSGTIVYEANPDFMGPGADPSSTPALDCYGGMPKSDPLPEIPPVTEADIAHRA